MSSRPIIYVLALNAFLSGPALADPPVALGVNATSSNTITIPLVVPAGGTGAQTLSVTYAGDVGPAGQSINVLIDGGLVGNLPGGAGTASCVFTYSANIVITDTVYTAAAADGTIDVTFTGAGPLGNVCENSGPTNYGPPFTVFNGGTGSAFAVTGQLTVGTAPVIPGAAGSPEAQQTSVAATRGALVLSNAPDTNARIQRLRAPSATRGLSFEGNTFLQAESFGLDIGRRGLSFSSRNANVGATFWAEARFSDVDDSTSTDQSFAVLHFGADWHASPSTFLGLGVQIDQFELTETASGDQFDADGWMVGPVVTHRLRDDLFFNGRLAFGSLATDVTRAAGVDHYDSARTVVELGLIGSTQIGAMTLAPHADIGWYRETSDAYTSGTLGAVAETEITVEQATLGARLSQSMSQWAGTLTPFVGANATYSEISGGTVVGGSFGDAISGWSGDLSVGAEYQGRTGLTWSAEIGMGGVGTDADSLSASFGFNLPF